MTYAPERLYEEIAYLAYHLHWSRADLLDLEHPERTRYLDQVAAMVTRANAEARHVPA